MIMTKETKKTRRHMLLPDEIYAAFKKKANDNYMNVTQAIIQLISDDLGIARHTRASDIYDMGKIKSAIKENYLN